MLPDSDQAKAEPFCADRIGFAKLTAMAFNGVDLRPLRDELIAKVVGGKLIAADARRAPPVIIKIVSAAIIPVRLTPLAKV